MLAFALAGGVLLLMAVVGRCRLVVMRTAGRGRAGRCSGFNALALAANYGGAVCGRHAAVAGCIIQRLTGNPMASPEGWGLAPARRLAWC